MKNTHERETFDQSKATLLFFFAFFFLITSKGRTEEECSNECESKEGGTRKNTLMDVKKKGPQ